MWHESGGVASLQTLPLLKVQVVFGDRTCPPFRRCRRLRKPPEMRRRPAMTTVNFSGFSCRLLDQGHETSSVSAYLGTISSPARYTELSPDRFKKVLAELTMLKASWPSSWQLPLFLCRAWTERSSTRCVVLWACMPHEVPIS